MLSDAALDAMDTERLLLRRQQESDAAVFRRLWTERDERVPPHRRIAPSGHPTVDDIVRQIRDRDSGPGPGLLTMERRETSAVIGYCGLVVAGKGNPEEPELAFEILRAEHNRGYATEAGAAVLEWARQAGYHRIRASVWDWNVASLRVLEKLGFEDGGVVVGESVHGRSLMMVRRLCERQGRRTYGWGVRAAACDVSTSSFPIERPLYRVNIWHEPAPGYAWNLEAWHLYDARDIFEVIEWVADHNKGRPYEVFVTNDDEAETEFAIRLIGADPNSRTSDR